MRSLRQALRSVACQRPLAGWLVLLMGMGSPLAAQDASAVAEAFETYRTAILASDGEAALGVVDAASVAYYGAMLDLALDADSARVARLPLLDEVMVIALRVRVPADTLRQMDGRSALAYGVAQGWIGRESVEQTRIGHVTVTGDSAWAEVRSGGQVVPKLRFSFSREADGWRFSLGALQALMSDHLTLWAKQSGMTDAELVRAMLLSVSEKPITPDAWSPVGR